MIATEVSSHDDSIAKIVTAIYTLFFDIFQVILILDFSTRFNAQKY